MLQRAMFAMFKIIVAFISFYRFSADKSENSSHFFKEITLPIISPFKHFGLMKNNLDLTV